MTNLVVITGGTKGLGLELVKLFYKNQKVLVVSKTKRDEIDGVYYEYGNIADEDFIKAVYQKYAKDYNISFLINNAGLGLFGAPETNTKEKIDKVIQANLVGLILNTTYAIPLLNPEGARIVNILSTAALKGNVNESLYCSAKWGAMGYTESLKATYKGSKIKVVSVCPGGMNTDFWANNRDYVPVEKSAKWLNPKDVAEVIYENITNDKLCVSNIVIERI